jgi:site-specific DNA recombinase
VPRPAASDRRTPPRTMPGNASPSGSSRAERFFCRLTLLVALRPTVGRIYRYYVTREAIADGYESCLVTSVPAADVEGAVLEHMQRLLAAPELVARTWAAAKREGEDDLTEREVTILLADFATIWNELFPAEQARIVQLLVERVDVQEDALEVRMRAEGLASLVGELRQQGERKAA